MDVWGITVAVLRRWYVFLPLLALTGLGAVMVGNGVRPQYEVTATTVLVPGTVETEVDGPYGSLESTNEVLAIVLDSAATRDAVEDQRLNPDYLVEAQTRSGIMDLTVLSDTRQESLDTGKLVIELARQELSSRQDAVGIASGAQLKLQVLKAPTVSDVVTDGKMRNMAVVGVVGAALSLVVAVLFDDLLGLVKRRTGRERVRRGPRSSDDNQVTRGARSSVAETGKPTRRARGVGQDDADEVDEVLPESDSATSDSRP